MGMMQSDSPSRDSELRSIVSGWRSNDGVMRSIKYEEVM
jgi:hypothetical protein